MTGFGKRGDNRHNPEHEQVENLIGFSIPPLVIGFGIAGFLGVLFLTPVLDNGARTIAVARDTVTTDPVDTTITGAIGKPEKARRYTIRRSVIQKNPAVPCYIFEDGSRKGGC